MGFYCKKCGHEYSSLSSLTNSWCFQTNNKEKCQLYEGHEHGPYHCKVCGHEYFSLSSLTNSWCYQTNNKEKCKPMEG